MTDNEIKRALECDTYKECKECPHYFETCENLEISAKDILDFINRLETENKNYSHNIKQLTNENMQLQKEVERLTKANSDSRQLNINENSQSLDFCGVLCNYAEDIINRQQAEIERLKALEVGFNRRYCTYP